MKSILFGLLLLLMVGCSGNVAPTASSAPPPTFTALPPPAVQSPTLPLTASAASNILRGFPLKEGATWVYLEQAYDTIPNDALPERKDRQITATLLITDTVVETQKHDAYYAAKVVRARSIITTSLDLALLGAYAQDSFANNYPDPVWYIFATDKVYLQPQELDWTSLESSIVEYKFPLVAGMCWYPDPTTNFDCSNGDPSTIIPGYRIVEALENQHLAAGDFENCFKISEIYNSGPSIDRFCLGVGVVGQDYDHGGTPFGSHSQLIQFTPGQ